MKTCRFQYIPQVELSSYRILIAVRVFHRRHNITAKNEMVERYKQRTRYSELVFLHPFFYYKLSISLGGNQPVLNEVPKHTTISPINGDRQTATRGNSRPYRAGDKWM